MLVQWVRAYPVPGKPTRCVLPPRAERRVYTHLARGKHSEKANTLIR